MDPWLETFARTIFRRSADTAHDLKTPLNVAVLNLELLRMRLRKLEIEDDSKIEGYAQAIETELRRMGRIFDSFFLLSIPGNPSDPPVGVDFASLASEVAGEFVVDLPVGNTLMIVAHAPRIRQAVQLFFEGAGRLLGPVGRVTKLESSEGRAVLEVSGTAESPELELPKIFKFYYTDREGNPDLSLAVARLVAETYGGELNAADERDKVTLRLSFPLGDR
jgi:nitrogen fixation/metabolism regulation signal transduction histidine kinase